MAEGRIYSSIPAAESYRQCLRVHSIVPCSSHICIYSFELFFFCSLSFLSVCVTNARHISSRMVNLSMLSKKKSEFQPFAFEDQPQSTTSPPVSLQVHSRTMLDLSFVTQIPCPFPCPVPHQPYLLLELRIPLQWHCAVWIAQAFAHLS